MYQVCQHFLDNRAHKMINSFHSLLVEILLNPQLEVMICTLIKLCAQVFINFGTLSLIKRSLLVDTLFGMLNE